MAVGDRWGRSARTVLEERIWQRRQTFEEFAEYAETFAREHGEPGTLSVRHLKRFAAGRGPDGSRVGRPRQATARLLERIFGADVEELLSAPNLEGTDAEGEIELRDRLRSSARVDATTLALLQDQLTATRRLDRQLGAPVAHGEVLAKIKQVTPLLHHSLRASHRQKLAEHLCELSTLAGWQALDMGRLTEAWQHHERGKAAAKESSNPEFEAHVTAEQAFVLIDLDEPSKAVELLSGVRQDLGRRSGRLMQAWLAASHGEALAAASQRSQSLRVFDHAAGLLPERSDGCGPYIALDGTHFARWRGHALARLGAPEGVSVLTNALTRLDPTFTRAKAALCVDLAIASRAANEPEQEDLYITFALQNATGIGSTRQLSRLKAFI
jgi:hypothetical protein